RVLFRSDFLDYFEQGAGTICQLGAKQVDAALKRGEAWLLFDGIDEIFDGNARTQIVQDIVRCSVNYPLARAIVTSRVIGYDAVASYFRDADFRHWLLQVLDEPLRARFIERWHALAYSEAAERNEKSGR